MSLRRWPAAHPQLHPLLFRAQLDVGGVEDGVGLELAAARFDVAVQGGEAHVDLLFDAPDVWAQWSERLRVRLGRDAGGESRSDLAWVGDEDRTDEAGDADP